MALLSLTSGPSKEHCYFCHLRIVGLDLPSSSCLTTQICEMRIFKFVVLSSILFQLSPIVTKSRELDSSYFEDLV